MQIENSSILFAEVVMKWFIFSVISAPVVFLPGCTLIPKEKVTKVPSQLWSESLSQP
ncbi:hypothetical protein CPK_ORF00908 [Chlamydia pneumoniae LPCoLN]|uniref:Uncharacterized protein n=1 Tax=Chlamydia pneumoniae TaxID=83558 RepID=Q9Z8E5_CHLPN|nr:hypothetical protein [Chlamydia pneumoniae]AAD18542.1 hypothetical protein CPn_0398 [Chlamydia pneumoniae CWL029]AAF38207.1 hypothetical protein CP_0357 [Chlamydia pneumoniae AR39]ACZ33375.1 hypothetical protein CPK_ORF00908 [Chlamydia pneumoniae LPCoLN]CRI32900.1 Uncharacterized protein BN1224_Wien1_A_04070 [Chlamydia pneumoniae]CRI35763.1 Uncharacterized protein BN1224_CM1_A_04100 [Chlamydia pneumoniae]